MEGHRQVEIIKSVKGEILSLCMNFNLTNLAK